jgi:hypothetical protein
MQYQGMFEQNLSRTREKCMSHKSRYLISAIIAMLAILAVQITAIIQVEAAGATSNIHVIKYAADGITILADKTVSYEWMQKMLPVQGDGKTHYFHQGPIFEGDMWDPGKTLNLKDKGAVKGTTLKDLCDLLGGMSPGDEASIVSVDGWHTEFTYENVYAPLERQGKITLCWYNGEDSADGETAGIGYPGNNTFHSAIQLVFMAKTANMDGKYVFGNADMKAAFPQGKYQHFYDGQYPSTNGLSGKWIAEVRIYSGGIPSGLKINYSTANYPSVETPNTEGTGTTPWVSIIFGIAGVLMFVLSVFAAINLRRINWKMGSVLILGVILIIAAFIDGTQPWQAASDKSWILTLQGSDGQQKVLSPDDIRDLPSYTGRGAFFTTVGVINGPYEAEGAPLTDLCQLVGGVTSTDGVMVTASDGYSTVFDYDQLMGDFITYDLKTLKEIPHGELKVVLMYAQDKKALSQDDGKPLRIAIVGAENILTEGNNWVRWVNKIEVLKLGETSN